MLLLKRTDPDERDPRMSNITIQAINAFFDNYIWCIHDSENAIIVDPGQADPVLQYLTENDLKLSAILVTHHHPDHVGGIEKLKEVFTDLTVIGFSQARYPGIEEAYSDGDAFERLGLSFRVLEVPGHTLDHIAYVTHVNDTPRLFSGDTLFSGGCGRLFEGSAEQMHRSLAKFKALPANTLVYCAHEYTLSNLKFAMSLMPENSDLKLYTTECEERREKKQSTIPSTLDTELKINPFLRESDPEIIDNLQKLGYINLNDAVSCFAAIRTAKDQA